MSRSIWVALLTAAALVPAASQAQDWRGERGDHHQPGEQARPDRGSRPQQQAPAQPRPQPGPGTASYQPRGDRPQPQYRSQPQYRTEQQQGARPMQRQPDQFGQGWQGDRANRGDRPDLGQRRADGSLRYQGGNPGAGTWRGGVRPDGTATRFNDPRGFQGSRPDGQWHDRDIRSGERTGGDRYGQWQHRDDGSAHWRAGGQSAGRYDDRGQWNRGWRSDRRYDWNGYRDGNRAAFRLPRYYAPRGWGYGYRRFSTGIRLNALLFSENYWIDDPYEYRLPEAYGDYRWVRYYDDALLVDIDTGEVVDTVYGIFE